MDERPLPAPSEELQVATLQEMHRAEQWMLQAWMQGGHRQELFDYDDPDVQSLTQEALLRGMAPLQYAQFVVLRVGGDEEGYDDEEAENDWSYQDLIELVSSGSGCYCT